MGDFDDPLFPGFLLSFNIERDSLIDTAPNTQGKSDRLMLKAGRTTAEIHHMTRQQRRAAERKTRKEDLT